MSLSHNQFVVFSPSYENISNRMNRLSRDKNTISLQFRQKSANHKTDLNTFSNSINDIPYYKPIRRMSPTTVTPDEHNYVAQRSYGKVTRNTGIKRYNQRQLKQVTNHKQSPHFNAHMGYENNYATASSDIQSPYNSDNKRDEVKIQQNYLSKHKTDNVSWQHKLIPGRIYNKKTLTTIT